MAGPTLDTFVEQLHAAAASGDTKLTAALIKGAPGNLDAKNERGWTALMLAARNGQSEVAQLLVDNRCDTAVINGTGQTALDIAKFWNHKDVVKLLSPSEEVDGVPMYSRQPAVVNYFSHQPLERAAHKRKDKEWLERVLKRKNTKFVMFSELKPLVILKPEDIVSSTSGRYEACIARYTDLEDHLASNPVIVLLGIEKLHDKNKAMETVEMSAWFAVDISCLTDEQVKKISPQGELVSVFPGMTDMSEEEGAILGEARSLLAWHDRYQFCPTCGNSTVVEEAGWKRKCAQEECRSHKGVHNTSYPRLDPTVIMAVISPDNKQLLLGRGSKFPKGFWSCLAGFVEPGEGIEDACRREVMEESGIPVGRVEYHSSQPWPLPASFMIGCLAYATDTKIKVDKEELEDARWFSRQDLVLMLTGQHKDRLFCPPGWAIAHQLIRAWINMSANL